MDLGTWVSGLLTESSWFRNYEKLYILLYFLVAQLVKNPPAMQETQVQPLGGEDPLEKETENWLLYLCPENIIDKRARWSVVHGVAKNWTRFSD